jgi:hypothetical protein
MTKPRFDLMIDSDLDAYITEANFVAGAMNNTNVYFDDIPSLDEDATDDEELEIRDELEKIAEELFYQINSEVMNKVVL